METLIAISPAQSCALFAQPDILVRGKFSKSHLYNLMTRGHFPKPCLVMGPRFTRWSAAEVDEWFENPTAWIATHGNSRSLAWQQAKTASATPATDAPTTPGATQPGGPA